MTTTVIGQLKQLMFDGPINIELPERGVVDSCYFKGPVKIIMRSMGFVVNNLFEDDVTIETGFMYNPATRKISTNIFHKKMKINGTFEISDNYNPKTQSSKPKANQDEI